MRDAEVTAAAEAAGINHQYLTGARHFALESAIMRAASKCAAVLLASAVLFYSACTRYADGDATATAGPELLAAAKSVS